MFYDSVFTIEANNLVVTMIGANGNLIPDYRVCA